MTTPIIHSIGATNTPIAMDYTSLAAWAAACPADLTVVDQQWVGQVYNQGEIVLTDNIILNATCSLTQCYILTAAPGASFIDNLTAGSNALRYNAANGAAITGRVERLFESGSYVRSQLEISRLQLRNSSTGGSPYGSILSSNYEIGWNLHECIVQDAGTNGYTAWWYRSTLILTNVLWVCEGGAAYNGFKNNGGVTMRNCTMIALGGSTGTAIGGGGSSAVNCALFGFLTVFATNNASTGSNNITDQANFGTNAPASPGTSGAAFSTANFVSLTGVTFGPGVGVDFRIPPGSALRDTGSGVTFAATDILGTPRPQGAGPDIGAYEYPTPIPVQWPIITWME